MTAPEERVASVLSDHPQTIRHLAHRTGLPRREVELSLQQLRLKGTPICSDARGVWVAQSAAELRETELALRDRARSQLRTYSAVRRARHRMEERETDLRFWQ